TSVSPLALHDALPIFTDRLVLLLQLRETRAHPTLTEIAHALENALLFEDVEGGDSGSASERVPRVGESAREGTLTEGVVNRLGDDHATERHVARVHALREGDEVGGDVKGLEAEPLTDTAEADHHLVADHHDAVRVAQRTHGGEVARRRREHTVA